MRIDASAVAEPCDIADADCQRMVLAMTASERGQPVPSLPSVRIIDNAQARSELKASATIRFDTSPDRREPALIALQLLPATKTSDDASLEQTAAFRGAYYDALEKRVTIIQDPAVFPADPRLAMARLAHEFAHYMQDLSPGLAELATHHDQTIDSVAAETALIEGEATVVGLRVRARLYGLAPDTLDWKSVFDEQEASYLDEISVASAALTTSVNDLPYPIGARYIAKLWDAYDRQHIDALFGNFPASMVDWLADDDHGMPAKSLLEAVSCSAPLSPSGFMRDGATTSLGVLGAVALLAAADATDMELASKLRGDSLAMYTQPLALYAGPSKPLLSIERAMVAWRLRFADESAAKGFAQAIRPLRLTQSADGREVLVTASTYPEQDSPSELGLAACEASQ
jgi:hypothetical protein